MDLDKVRIAQGLKALRLQKNYTQEYLADYLGKGDYSAYYRIESGKTELKFDDAYKLAELYEVTMEEIYNPGTSNNSFREPKAAYNPKNSLHINVVLDGKPDTLKKQVDLLTQVNALLA